MEILVYCPWVHIGFRIRSRKNFVKDIPIDTGQEKFRIEHPTGFPKRERTIKHPDHI